MANILILSANRHSATAWQYLLSAEHEVLVLNDPKEADNLIRQQSVSLVVIDADLFNTDDTPLPLFSASGIKSLVIGDNWTDERQIKEMVAGHSGFCEAETAAQQLLKATNSILDGDIWIKRNLVPTVIGMLINFNNLQPSQPNQKAIEFKKNLLTLTHRELDVAKMISTGESNKMIASMLNISERTVKAHLTSIFQKLNVQDRLHLAILFKENG